MSDLLRFRANGFIGPFQFGPAAFAVRDNDQWTRMTTSFVALLGAGYLFSALAFVLAARWQYLSQWQIFFLLLVTLVLLVLTALCVGLRSSAGEIALIGATLITGLLLCLLDRIYLDPPTDFAMLLVWPVVVLPWLALSRSPAHWIVWMFIVIALTGFVFSHYLMPPGSVPAPFIPFFLAAVPAVALYAAETMRHRETVQLPCGWPRCILLTALLGLLYAALLVHLFPQTELLIAYDAGAASVVIYFATNASSIWYYRFRAPDQGGFATAIMFAFLAVSAIGSRLILDRFGQDPLDPSGLIGWLLLLVWISACLAATAALLHRQFNSGTSGNRYAG